MVLSDGRIRERYDRQLDQREAERRMREKMMEEERLWVDEQGEGWEGWDDGAGEEQVRDPVYNKRAEVMDGDGGTNKFGQRFRGQQQQGGVRQQGPDMGSFGARSLHIDEEAKQRQQQEQEQHQQAGYMAAEAEREALLVRERNEAQAHLAQEQARERKQQFDNERRRGEKRRASSERDVIQDRPMKAKQAQQSKQGQEQGQPQQATGQRQPWQDTGTPQDTNEMMANMKRNFSQKKMDEAERVKDEIRRG